MNFDFKTFSNSPLGAITKVILLILGGEFIIMLAIEFVFPTLFGDNRLAPYWKYIDPFLLLLLVAPPLQFWVLRPMTEQKLKIEQQTNQLIESEDNFRSIVNQIIFGVVQNDTSGCVTYVNSRFCEMTGYSSEELIGKNWQSFTHPDDLPRNITSYDKNVKVEKTYVIEKRYVTKNGEAVWVALGASPRHDTSGNLLGYTAVVMDITNRKVLERKIQEQLKEMQQLQKLHVSNQTALAIAHELNQPLLAISAYSKAATMMLNSEQPDFDEIKAALDANEKQAYRAGKTIRDMLESLMIHEFPVEVLDLNREIMGCIDTVRYEDGLQFELTLDLEKSSPLVKVNRMHLEKVLSNLLQNSCDAMREASVLQPSITVTTLSIKHENVARISIQDNGPGISKEISQRLFEPLFSTKITGIGMGLAVSRSLIEENGGKLWIDPQESTGATFHFTLPLAT